MRHLAYIAVFVLLFVVILIPNQHVRVAVRHNSEWSPVYATYHGMEMVFVPKGCFHIGIRHDLDGCLDHAYWLGRSEVTRAQFNQFVREASSGYRTHGHDSNEPIDDVSWFEAHDFCAEYGMRLPSYAELGYAAGGPDGRFNRDVSGKWVDVLGLLDVVEWTGSLDWDDIDNSEGNIDKRRFLGGYDVNDYEKPDVSFGGAAAYSFRCAFSPYQRREWEPRMYAGYKPPPTPTPTPQPTDLDMMD